MYDQKFQYKNIANISKNNNDDKKIHSTKTFQQALIKKTIYKELK